MTQPCLDHAGFLASPEVLESVLLPHLSAKDLFHLSCTSKQMQQWLLGTSPQLWKVCKLSCLCALGGSSHHYKPGLSEAQHEGPACLLSTGSLLQDEQPSNVCPGYLAALPSTAEVLAALQQAHRAKLAILAKSGPVQQTTIALAPLISGSFSSWEGQKVSVKQVAFSADGQYLALGLLCCATQHGRVLNSVAAFLVFSATGGFAKQSCICGPPGSSDPKIQWAADAPLLTIAHKIKVDIPDSLPAEQAALRVLDAATGQIVHAIGPHNEAALRQGFEKAQRFSQMELSPSASLLLVTSCCWEYSRDADDDITGQGDLLVLDVVQDKVVLRSNICMAITEDEAQRLADVMGMIAWHPSSTGLLFAHCVDLQSQEFAKAGLATAILPGRCYLNTCQPTTFSPDGQKLAVASLEGPYIIEAVHTILRCSLTGTTMTLVPELCIRYPMSSPYAVYGCQWLPCSSRMVLWVQDDLRGSLLVDMHGEAIQAWQAPMVSPPFRFNFSQQLLTDASWHPRILRADIGQELWEAASIHFPSFKACGSLFLPSGCGLLSAADNEIHLTSFA